MGVTRGLETLFAVALVAALAPVVVAVLPGPRIPQVVIFLLGGVLIGPHVLGLANTASITLLSNIGLGFLFLLAGYAGSSARADSTGQTTCAGLRCRFGLDVVLGALMASIVLRGWTRQMNMDTTGLENKFDAVGYGIFIPIFFVASGMTLDLKAIGHDPLRVILFFVLLLVVRGLPSLLIYRRVLSLRQRAQMTFITATTMPLLIALAEIGKRDGVMLPATSAALVGAGLLSVLIYPPIAVALGRGGLVQRTGRGRRG